MPEMITLEDAQAHLAEIIANLPPGEELLITQDEQLIAKLIGQAPATHLPRKPGSAAGKLLILSEDDEHLDDFREYMP